MFQKIKEEFLTNDKSLDKIVFTLLSMLNFKFVNGNINKCENSFLI